MGAADYQAGDVLGPYRIEAVLGQGAVGVVYLAEHRRLGRPVALKVLKASLSADEVQRKRLLREARVAAEVEHENLVPIIEAGEINGRCYLAEEYVRGRSLDERLEEGPLSLDEALRLAAEIAAALDTLHDHRLVHRDVKPSNVMLDESGRALLADFGLARGPAYTALTKPGQVLGTLDYLAPELIRGEAASALSDVYSFGCLVFACIAGEPPFAHRSLLEVATAHLGEPPGDPCVGRSDLPSALSAAVLEALAKEPAERPPTARAYALRLWIAGKPGSR
jgi:serine/threonine-protein kinase